MSGEGGRLSDIGYVGREYILTGGKKVKEPGEKWGKTKALGPKRKERHFSFLDKGRRRVQGPNGCQGDPSRSPRWEDILLLTSLRNWDQKNRATVLERGEEKTGSLRRNSEGGEIDSGSSGLSTKLRKPFSVGVFGGREEVLVQMRPHLVKGGSYRLKRVEGSQAAVVQRGKKKDVL